MAYAAATTSEDVEKDPVMKLRTYQKQVVAAVILNDYFHNPNPINSLSLGDKLTDILTLVQNAHPKQLEEAAKQPAAKHLEGHL